MSKSILYLLTKKRLLLCANVSVKIRLWDACAENETDESRGGALFRTRIFFPCVLGQFCRIVLFVIEVKDV